jgi:hypothetical protein
MPEEDKTCQVNVKGVYLMKMDEGIAPTVILEGPAGKIMPIYIGHLEALSINNALNRETTPRPMTHDLLMSILSRMEGKVENVLIDEKAEGVFYARLTLSKNDVKMEFDARPSDCIALALRADVPIKIKDEILENDVISPDKLDGAKSFESLL